MNDQNMLSTGQWSLIRDRAHVQFFFGPVRFSYGPLRAPPRPTVMIEKAHRVCHPCGNFALLNIDICRIKLKIYFNKDKMGNLFVQGKWDDKKQYETWLMIFSLYDCVSFVSYLSLFDQANFYSKWNIRRALQNEPCVIIVVSLF